MRSKPIGIFDSGVGGLTVAREVHRLMPGEDIIYFGDTVHLPYGSKSPAAVMSYSLNNTAYLLSRGVKLVVVACNTSTAIAINRLKREFPVPIIGVVQPGSAEAVKNSRSGKIGVIGTYRTIHSGAYADKIRSMNKKTRILQKACPLIVPIIEEGFKNDSIIRSVLKEYLSPLSGRIDTLVLGCTHYPLIKQKIRKLYPKLKIVDSAVSTARAVRESLSADDMFAARKKGRVRITTNDINEVFAKISGRLFPGNRISQVSLPVKFTTRN